MTFPASWILFSPWAGSLKVTVVFQTMCMVHNKSAQGRMCIYIHSVHQPMDLPSCFLSSIQKQYSSLKPVYPQYPSEHVEGSECQNTFSLTRLDQMTWFLSKDPPPSPPCFLEVNKQWLYTKHNENAGTDLPVCISNQYWWSCIFVFFSWMLSFSSHLPAGPNTLYRWVIPSQLKCPSLSGAYI